MACDDIALAFLLEISDACDRRFVPVLVFLWLAARRVDRVFVDVESSMRRLERRVGPQALLQRNLLSIFSDVEDADEKHAATLRRDLETPLYSPCGGGFRVLALLAWFRLESSAFLVDYRHSLLLRWFGATIRSVCQYARPYPTADAPKPPATVVMPGVWYRSLCWQRTRRAEARDGSNYRPNSSLLFRAASTA